MITSKALKLIFAGLFAINLIIFSVIMYKIAAHTLSMNGGIAFLHIFLGGLFFGGFAGSGLIVRYIEE